MKKTVSAEVRFHLLVSVFFGTLGTSLLMVGLAGLFIPALIQGISFGLLLLTALAVGYWITPESRNQKNVSEAINRFGGLFFTIVSAFLLLQSFSPPHSRDALIHHLALPAWFLRVGRVIDLPFAEAGYYPMILEFLFSIPLSLGVDWLAATLHAVFAILTAHLIFLFIQERFSTAGAWIGALLFLTLPVVMQSASQADVDLGVTYFAVLSWFLLLSPQTDSFKQMRYSTAGFAMGLSMASKYNGFLVFSLSTVLLLMQSLREEWSAKQARNRIGAFVGCSLLVVSPWMIRNCIWTGDPIFPYFRNLFGWRPTEAFSAPTIPALLHRRYLYGESWGEILALPVRIFFQGIEGDPKYFDGRLSPVLCIAALIIFVPRIRKMSWMKSMGFMILAYGVYAGFLQILRMRYLLPIIPLFVIGATSFVESITQKWRKPFRGVLVIGILFQGYLAWEGFRTEKPLSVLLGQVSRADYLQERLPEYGVQRFASDHLTQNDRILFVLLGHRGYYCDIPYQYDFHDPGRSWRRWLEGNPDLESLKSRIQEEGITHIMLHRTLLESAIHQGFMLEREQVNTLEGFLRSPGTLLYQKAGVELYAL